MSKSWDAVVGLGSNLGDRLGNLRGALVRLGAVAPFSAVSAVYESKAVGPPQPNYLNAAVRLSSSLLPDELLRHCLRIEDELGRRRTIRWGPRTIDLDILWVAGQVLSTPRLQVPHPELSHRPFALVPLLDVAPHATDPVTGARYADIAEAAERPLLAHAAGAIWPT
jgi:2-amino-4-hydroxy-6-hydroxymethyldihydropteridine diphosphokinase